MANRYRFAVFVLTIVQQYPNNIFKCLVNGHFGSSSLFSLGMGDSFAHVMLTIFQLIGGGNTSMYLHLFWIVYKLCYHVSIPVSVWGFIATVAWFQIVETLKHSTLLPRKHFCVWGFIASALATWDAQLSTFDTFPFLSRRFMITAMKYTCPWMM